MSEHITFIGRIGLVGIAKFITSLRGLILLPILAKTLGVVGYGIWAQILVTIGLLISFVTLNLSAGMVRFLPAEKEKRKIARAIFTVIFTVLFVAVVFALVLFLLSDPFAKILLKDASASFFIKIAAFLLVLEALGQTSLESFRIFGQIKRYSTLIVLQTFLEIGLVSLLTLSGFGLLGVLIAFLIARSIILLFSLLFIVSYVGFAVPCFGILRSYLVFALPLIPIGLLEVIIASSDRYIIGFFKGSASVGIYSATYNIGLIAGIFIFPIAYILSPTVFKLFDEKKIEKVKMYLSYSLKYFLLISIPSVFGLTILTKSVLFVSLSSIFYGIQAIFGRALMLFKHTKSFLIAFIVAAIINLGLNIVLIPCWGIIGAAITTLIAYALSAIIIYCKSRQYIKFNFDLNFVIKSMVASSVMAGAIYIFNPIGIIKILLAIGFGATIYFYILFLLKGFGKREIEIIYRVLKFKKSQTKKYEQTF